MLSMRSWIFCRASPVYVAVCTPFLKANVMGANLMLSFLTSFSPLGVVESNVRKRASSAFLEYLESAHGHFSNSTPRNVNTGSDDVLHTRQRSSALWRSAASLAGTPSPRQCRTRSQCPGAHPNYSVVSVLSSAFDRVRIGESREKERLIVPENISHSYRNGLRFI